MNIVAIASQFRPYELAKVLPFQDAMRLADRLLTYDPMHDYWRNYAIEFLYSIRDHFPKEWGLSWRYDAYLGEACAFANRYDERYEAYQQAMCRVSPIPPELLVALASCNSAPGKPPVSEEDALKILTKVAYEKPYKDVIRMIIKGNYQRFKEHPEELLDWKKLYKTLEESDKGENLPSKSPKFLEENIKTDLSKLKFPPTQDKDQELLNISKKFFLKERLSPSILGIAVEWQNDEIILWIYHIGELDADTDYISFMAYTRIAANYLKDYSSEGNRAVQMKSTKELPYHKNWVFLKNNGS